MHGPELAVRRALQLARVTLDGRPASIIGASAPVATVFALDGSRICECSWANARSVVESGGRFAGAAT